MISPILSFQNLYSNNFKNNRQHQVVFQGRDLLKLTQLGITKKVRSAVQNNNNIIGSGGEGVVYRIPNTDYCVKITGKDILHFGNWNMDVPIPEKFNHVVAISDNGTRIMRIIEGEHLDYINNPDEVYSLPAESYIGILKQFTEAKKYGKYFDISPKNIIYNPKQKTLTAIDFTVEESFDYDEFMPLSLLFKAMRDETQTISTSKRNRQLIARLLQVALDSIHKGGEPEFPISYNDIDTLLSYGLKILPQGTSARKFNNLKKNIFEILKLKEDEVQSTEKKIFLSKKIESAKANIDKLFCAK